MTPFILTPPTCRERRTIRAHQTIARDHLRALDRHTPGSARRPELLSHLALLTALLHGRDCPECGSHGPFPKGLPVRLHGITIGRACGSCTDRLRGIEADAR